MLACPHPSKGSAEQEAVGGGQKPLSWLQWPGHDGRRPKAAGARHHRRVRSFSSIHSDHWRAVQLYAGFDSGHSPSVGLEDISIEEVHAFMNQIPFNRYLGIELQELSPGFARMLVPFREELIGDFVRGALHGGVLSALIDTCGGAAIWTQTAAGDRLSTVDLRVDYLRPGRAASVCCEGRVLRLGNRVGVADMRAFHVDKPDEVIATGKGVYNVSRSRVKSAEPPGEP